MCKFCDAQIAGPTVIAVFLTKGQAHSRVVRIPEGPIQGDYDTIEKGFHGEDLDLSKMILE